MRSYIKHLKECFIRYPNFRGWLKKTRLRRVFSTHISVFGYLMKHFSLCLFYYYEKLLGYSVYSDLSSGKSYPLFQQLGPGDCSHRNYPRIVGFQVKITRRIEILLTFSALLSHRKRLLLTTTVSTTWA